MAIQLFANNAATTLASPINDVTTTLTVAPGTAVLFPDPGANEYFVSTLSDALTGLEREIVWVTAVSGDVLTIVRAQEGTTAQSWNTGDNFIMYFTAGSAAALLQQGQYQEQSANSGVDVGTVNAIAVTLDPAPTALSGILYAPIRVKVAHTTTSTTVTLNVNGLGAISVVNTDGSNPAIGAMPAGGICEFYYDGTHIQYAGQIPSSGGGGTVTSIQALSPGLTGGTITTTGTIGINPASSSQVQAGTDNSQAVTSLAIAGAMAFVHGNPNKQVFANGNMIQSGRFTSLAHGQIVTFATPFPNACTLSSDVGYSGSGDPWIINLSLNGTGPFTGFTVWAWQVGSGGPTPTTGAGIGWIAFGN